MFVLVISSCEYKDVRARSPLYGEWKWKATLFLNGNVYRSAAQLDTTFYLNFKANGVLELKDINKTTKSTERYEVKEVKQNVGIITCTDVNNSQWHFNYSIENNELKASNIEGFLVWIEVYERADGY